MCDVYVVFKNTTEGKFCPLVQSLAYSGGRGCKPDTFCACASTAGHANFNRKLSARIEPKGYTICQVVDADVNTVFILKFSMIWTTAESFSHSNKITEVVQVQVV